jgi:hypothetical protein
MVETFIRDDGITRSQADTRSTVAVLESQRRNSNTMSNLMPRGEVRPVATRRAAYPLATEGAAYAAVKVDEQDPDAELELL